jgi:two-component system sensor histidine kinase PilS (NtrC family)
MAVGSTFLRGQTNIALAAFATLLVLCMSLISIFNGLSDGSAFFTAGVTGVLLFVTAIAFRIFSEKVQASQHTAKRQTEQADYLQLISQRIVETMRTGIIVVDRNLRIQLINHSAALLLTVNDKFEGITKIEAIDTRLKQWQNDGIIPASFSVNLANNQTIKVGFSQLDDARFPSLMLFIEDMQRLSQEAQQLKLASLGRLTASIAHEIRNPLGAISHAGQLLHESKTISHDDQQLLDIIYKHSQRINFIINNILEFSRRKSASPEVINLNQWIADFKTEYLQYHTGTITIDYQERHIQAKIDPNHLYQIINNLADNGLRYSQQSVGAAILHIHIGIQTKDQRPFIKVIDLGKGIDADKLNHIFEPFYTTEAMGSGLGLYLCKELSEANQANLSYSYDNDNKKSIFTLLLSHPQRRIELE